MGLIFYSLSQVNTIETSSTYLYLLIESQCIFILITICEATGEKGPSDKYANGVAPYYHMHLYSLVRVIPYSDKSTGLYFTEK